MANQAFTGVVLLNKPTVDKIAALAIIRTYQPELPTDPEVISFWSRRDCPTEQIEKWRQNGVFPVDLGREKYQQGSVGKRFGSAAEFVADFFGLSDDPAVSQVVGEVNDNNRTGRLKGYHLSVAYLIRKLYELPEQYDMRDVVNRACHAVQVRIVSFKSKSADWRTITSLAEELPDLWHATAHCNFAPYTVGEYLRNLWRQGYSVEDIRSWVEFWLNAAEDVETAKENAEAELPNTPGEEFEVRSLGKCRYLETENTFVTTAAAERWPVVIVQNSKGQMAVQTTHLDIAGLAREVQRLEPDRWFYDSRQGCLINGGVIYTDTPASQLGRRMVELAQKFPPRRNQQSWR